MSVKERQNILNLLLREVNLTWNLHTAIAYRRKMGSSLLIHCRLRKAVIPGHNKLTRKQIFSKGDYKKISGLTEAVFVRG